MSSVGRVGGMGDAVTVVKFGSHQRAFPSLAIEQSAEHSDLPSELGPIYLVQAQGG